MYEVIVIGTGWSGLVAAKTYLQINPGAKLLIVDNASTVGGTWCKERLYPHLVAEAHRGLFEFSDLQMYHEGRGISSSSLISGEAVHEYLSNYATKFGLHSHLLLQTKVERASRAAQHWQLTLAGSDEILTSEKLIVATGITSEPFVPDIPNDGFTGEVMHSKELGKTQVFDRGSDKQVRSVVVYGGSKSAFDAVYMLLRAGKRVEWVVRGGKGGPSIMTPLKILGQPSFRLNNTRFLGIFSPNLYSNDSISRFLHGPSLSWLTNPLVCGFWRLLAWLLQREAAYGESENSRVLRPAMGLDSLFWSPATLGVMTHPELWDDIHQGTRVIVRQNAVVRLDKNGVNLDDGTCLDADMLILATGWKPLSTNLFSDKDCLDIGLPSPASYDPEVYQKRVLLRQEADSNITLTLPILSRSPGRHSHQPRVENDFHLYRCIIPAAWTGDLDGSLAFVGFLRSAGAPLVYEAQALWAAAYLQGKLKTPPPDGREREAASFNAWARRRYICGRKVPIALFDFIQYVDVLYNDLGVNSRRKRNFVSEMFSMYKPSDFKGIVDEWVETQKDR